MRIDALPARRRALTLTPLIDVIFLLLLFFMLASTFLDYARMDVSAGTAGGTGGEQAKAILRVHEGGAIDVNGRAVAAGEDAATALAAAGLEDGARVAVMALDGATTADLVKALEAVRLAGHDAMLVAH